MAIEPKGHRLLARWEWWLSFCTAVFLFVGSEAFAQQATPLDFTAAIRTVSGLNADGLESKSFRDEYCKPLPAERVGQCRNHMETIADSRRRLDLAMNAVEDAAKKGLVDLKILQRLDAQVAAYIAISSTSGSKTNSANSYGRPFANRFGFRDGAYSTTPPASIDRHRLKADVAG